jgi:hypothetical protein
MSKHVSCQTSHCDQGMCVCTVYFPAYKPRLFSPEIALSCALRVIRRSALYMKFVWQKLKSL